MKALVLCGGSGTRLRPFTYSIAKQLVPVANKPVLLHGLERIREVGVVDVAIVVGDRADQIVAVVGDGSAFGLRVTYLRQDAPLGLAHTVLLAADHLGNSDFLMYLGDNVFAAGIADAARSFRTHRPDAHLVVAKVEDPRRYGVAEVDPSGRVRALVEKPSRPRSDLAVTGAYFFTAAIHDAVAAIRPSARGELEITDAIAHLIATGRTVTAEEYTGYWRDTGRVDDLLDCNRALLDCLHTDIRGTIDAATGHTGSIVVAAGARVRNSRLIGPVSIGPGTLVDGSRIGPYVAIGRDCRIVDSTVRDSITLDGVTIRGVDRLHRSLIGHSARVSAGGPQHRLIIGDHTHAEIG